MVLEGGQQNDYVCLQEGGGSTSTWFVYCSLVRKANSNLISGLKTVPRFEREQIKLPSQDFRNGTKVVTSDYNRHIQFESKKFLQ